MSQSEQAPVRRRHVLFFGGFDPKGASWYHAMYSRHAARQAAVNGLVLEVGPRKRDAEGRQHWLVESADAAGDRCLSRIEVIGWDAVVRRYWPRSAPAVLAQMLRAYARMAWHGPRELLRVLRLAPRTLFALVYPLLFFAAGALASLVLALLLGWLAALLGAGNPVPFALGALAFVLLLFALARLERRLDTSLLARILAFVADYAVRGIPELDAQLAQAALRIRELQRSNECDEVLVVGYSVGSILATRALAQALDADDGAAPAGAPALALLTLGNCIPLYGLFPQAATYREELARLATSARLRWVDVSSPVDWGSFALLDPLDVCAIELPARGCGSPLITSPRFHTLIEPARYQAMIRNKHAMHTLYLMSTDKPGRYDWFAITAGRTALRERYREAAEPRAKKAKERA